MKARTGKAKLRVLVVTGSRSEFGLLRPVMEAVRKHKRLKLLVAVAGEHLLRPALTWREVAAEFRIDARIPMQRQRDRGRGDHAAACGRGVDGFAAAYKRLEPDWVVVLGDRVEAFAAASAASIAGIAVCHIHGGDRAEGIADEAMRHAITKLAHLHCAATKLSAERIRKMGEKSAHVFVTGSPAIDGLDRIGPMADREYAELGSPKVVVILHPAGQSSVPAEHWIGGALFLAYVLDTPVAMIYPGTRGPRPLVIGPNHDPGRQAILDAWREESSLGRITLCEHLPRDRFLSLLKRLAAVRGMPSALVGNSSAGLIEAAALRVPAVNLGPRQEGRERGENVLDVAYPSGSNLARAAKRLAYELCGNVPGKHPFGDGRAGTRIAALLAKFDPHDPALLRKRNSY